MLKMKTQEFFEAIQKEGNEIAGHGRYAAFSLKDSLSKLLPYSDDNDAFTFGSSADKVGEEDRVVKNLAHVLRLRNRADFESRLRPTEPLEPEEDLFTFEAKHSSGTS